MSPFNRVLSRVSHRTRFDDVGRDAIVAAIGGLTMVAVVAARMTPPATLIADRYSTLAAILMSATVVTALVAMHDRMERPGRLLAVVLLGATAMAWYSGRLWVHEKQFDYLVDQQKAELEWRTVELYGDLANFLRSRAVAGPPPPRPDSWDRDENAVLTYEQETSLLYRGQVRGAGAADARAVRAARPDRPRSRRFLPAPVECIRDRRDCQAPGGAGAPARKELTHTGQTVDGWPSTLVGPCRSRSRLAMCGPACHRSLY